MNEARVGVLGAGLAGCCVALALSKKGIHVDLIDRQTDLMRGASLHNEGKLHLSYVYAADPESQTHELMCLGSLRFLGILEELTGVPREAFRKSFPFIYGVPTDSQLDIHAIHAHFSAVDKAIARVYKRSSKYLPHDKIRPFFPLDPHTVGQAYNPDKIQACFQTFEYSLDTAQVAEAIRASIRADSGIHLRLNTLILNAEPAAGGDHVLNCLAQGQRRSYRYKVVINCLWDDRLRVDASVGITPERPWLMRYKAAIWLRQKQNSPADTLPSSTLITGPYGDVVNHGDGNIYVSWYPVCKLGETRSDDCTSLHEMAAAQDGSRLVKESLKAIADYMPGVASLLEHNESVTAGGGVIFAWGKTDITDPSSGLHQRHQIGPKVHGRWVSLDTGKYCMAPHFALQVADQLHRELR